MTTEELDIKLKELCYSLDEMYEIMVGLRKEWLERGNDICALRIHTICVHIWDLLDVLDSFAEVEKSIIGELKL